MGILLLSSFPKYLSRVRPSCNLPFPRNPAVHQISAHLVKDQFVGLIITLQDVVNGKRAGPYFEAFYQPVSNIEIDDTEGDAGRRLDSVFVSSVFGDEISACKCHTAFIQG